MNDQLHVVIERLVAGELQQVAVDTVLRVFGEI